MVLARRFVYAVSIALVVVVSVLYWVHAARGDGLVLQAPPALPATIYGSVSIICGNGSIVDAPAGVPVSAVAPNGSVLASTSTGEGTSEPSQYLLKIEGYEGTVYLYVGSIKAGEVSVSAGSVVEANLTVSDNEPPSAPSDVTVEPLYSPSPVISWQPASDNLGVREYVVAVVNSSGVVVFSASVKGTSVNLTGLADGRYVVSVYAVDYGCNRGPVATREFIVDTAPPVVTGVEPVNGSYVAASGFTINVSVFDLSPRLYVKAWVDSNAVNASIEAAGEASWIVRIVIPGVSEGSHRVNIVLQDDAGHNSSLGLVYVADGSPPLVVPVSGPLGSWSNSSSGIIAFNVTDSLSGVDWGSIEAWIDGARVEISFDRSLGLVRITYGLGDGNHSVRLRVADVVGNVAEFDGWFGVDTAAPSVYIESPRSGEVVSTTNVCIKARVSDALSGVNWSSVRVAISGVGVVAASVDPASGSVEACTSLGNGEYTAVVRAADIAGNRGEARVSFSVQIMAADTVPPRLVSVTPENGSVIGMEGFDRVVLRVEEKESGVSCAMVRVNGVALGAARVSMVSDGVYEVVAELRPGVLRSGINTVVVRVCDAAGNALTVRLVYQVDAAPPVVLSVEPRNGTLLASKRVVVKIRLSDDSGVIARVSAVVNGRPVKVSLQGWLALVEFNASRGGLYVLNVTAVDPLGRAGVYRLVYYADWEPPVVEAEPQYITPDGVVSVRVYDDAMEALLARGVAPVVEGPAETVAWHANGTLVLRVTGVEEARPVEVNVSIRDLWNRTASRSFYVVIGVPVEVQVEVEPGRQLIGVPAGVVPSVFEELLSAACPGARVFEVSADWSLREGVVSEWAPALLVESGSSCSLSYTGYVLPVNTSIYTRMNGLLGVVVPLKPAPAADLGGGYWLLYSLDAATGRWRVAAMTWAGLVGDAQVLEPGRAYLVARLSGGLSLMPPALGVEEEASAPGAAAASPSRGGAPGFSSLLLPVAWLAAAAAAARSTSRRRLAAALLLLLFFSATAAAAQEARIVSTPAGGATVEPGGVLTLVFNASYSGSYQSLVLVELSMPEGFSLEDYKIVMNGAPQQPRVERSGGNVSLLVDDLQPPNGDLSVVLRIRVPSEPGNYTVKWRFVVQAMEQLAPQPPVERSGFVDVTVPSAETGTEATTTTGAAPGEASSTTTTAATSPPATTTQSTTTAAATTSPRETTTAMPPSSTETVITATQPATQATTPAGGAAQGTSAAATAQPAATGGAAASTPQPQATATGVHGTAAGTKEGGSSTTWAAVALILVAAAAAALLLRRH